MQLVFPTVPESSQAGEESRLDAAILAAHDLRVDARRLRDEAHSRTPRDEASLRGMLIANEAERSALKACGRAEASAYRGDAEEAACWIDLARTVLLGEDLSSAWWS